MSGAISRRPLVMGKNIHHACASKRALNFESSLIMEVAATHNARLHNYVKSEEMCNLRVVWSRYLALSMSSK